MSPAAGAAPEKPKAPDNSAPSLLFPSQQCPALLGRYLGLY